MGFWEAIWEFLESLCLWEILNPDEVGVHLRFGKVRRTVGEGLHWKLPWIDEIQSVSTAEQAIDLPNQSLTTKDLHTITISGTIRYEIIDPLKVLFQVDDFDESMQTLAMEVIGDQVSRSDFSADTKKLRDKISRKLEKKVSAWGIDIISVGISDNAKTRALRIYQ